MQNFILIGGAEAQRNAESDDEKRKYPGESSSDVALVSVSCMPIEVHLPACRWCLRPSGLVKGGCYLKLREHSSQPVISRPDCLPLCRATWRT